jgi:hypothetical protein
MPRLMSFALTKAQILDRSKTVTRRRGWDFLKPGDRLTACAKVMGRKGAPLERLAELRVTGVRRELLTNIDADDVSREGFPGMTRDDFLRMWRDNIFRDLYIDVTRIEFEYVDREPREGSEG